MLLANLINGISHSRVRCLTFPKMLLSILCVVILLGIAIMVSAGVALYCDSQESAWKTAAKKSGVDVDFPGYVIMLLVLLVYLLAHLIIVFTVVGKWMRHCA